jgi:hypothetical protein
LCIKVGVSRSRLSLIERGFLNPPQEELARIENGLDQLIQTKSAIASVAASLGWPVGVPHDE